MNHEGGKHYAKGDKPMELTYMQEDGDMLCHADEQHLYTWALQFGSIK